MKNRLQEMLGRGNCKPVRVSHSALLLLLLALKSERLT